MPWPCSAEIGVALVEAEARELRRVLVPALDLVHDDEHALAVAPQPPRDRLVVRQQARAGVHDEQHDVRLLDRALAPGAAAGPSSGSSLPSSRPPVSTSSNGRPCQLDLRVVAVARRAGPAVGDRLAAAADAVEQRGLTDVGPADEGDSGRGIMFGGVPGRV